MILEAKFDAGDLSALSGIPLLEIDKGNVGTDLANPAFGCTKRIHTLTEIIHSKSKTTYSLNLLGAGINLERPSAHYTEEEILKKLNDTKDRYYRPLSRNERESYFDYWYYRILGLIKL